MTTTQITVYKVHSPESKKIYIGTSTSNFHRLVLIMTSRFKQYMNLLEIKTPTTEEQNKMKLYHHPCFEVLQNGGIITHLAYYDYQPTDNICIIKRTLTKKFIIEINPESLIKPKNLFSDKTRKPIDVRYREKNKETIRQKALKQNVCQICQGRYKTVHKSKHLLTVKHVKALNANALSFPNTSTPFDTPLDIDNITINNYD